MKFLPLVWAGLWRKRARTLLTLLSVVTAFLLFGMLQGVIAAFANTVENARLDRMNVFSSVSFGTPLPISYLSQIEAIPGVTSVTHTAWFGSYYRDPKNFIAAFPVEPRKFLHIIPEVPATASQTAALIGNRIGALVGGDLARKNGWKVGDHVSLRSMLWPRAGGSSDWEFDIVGVFESPSTTYNSYFLFNREYFEEARTSGKGTTGWYILTVSDPQLSAEVAHMIDDRFVNSPDQTRTQSEKEFATTMLKQVGDIDFIVRAILGAVFFTLLFLTGNTMMQSVRDRIPELAVLKTLGFTDGGVLALVLAESLLLCMFAAAIGLGLAAAIFPLLKQVMGGAALQPSVLVLGAGVAVLLALVTGIPPALRAKRLNIVDALAGR